VSCGGRLPAPTIETPSRPLILLVDDDPVVQLTLARALTERGYDVRTAADGQAVMSYWRWSEPAIMSTRKGRASGGSLPFASLGFMTVGWWGIRWIVRRGEASHTRAAAAAAPQTKLLEHCGCAISQPVPTEHNQRLEGVS
jgi:DNA-binding NarL/FixJ family response regulator